MLLLSSPHALTTDPVSNRGPYYKARFFPILPPSRGGGGGGRPPREVSRIGKKRAL
jgi:hypothetical protein